MTPRAAPWRLACCVLALVPSHLVAQHDPVPAPVPAVAAPAINGSWQIRGRVVRATTDGDLPVTDTWVTLHRIARTNAGPVDSIRTDRAGAYALRYAVAPSDSSSVLLIASARYAGIAYFSAPLQSAPGDSDAALITVFDTSSTGVRLHVLGRHVIVSGADAEGARIVHEVFEISNDTTITRVAGGDSGPVFTTRLPDAATDPTVAQGDIAAGAVTFRDGRAEVFAPVAPGLRQLAFSYTLPGRAFPFDIPIPDGVGTFEVLVEDPGGNVSGGGLTEQTAVNVEGREFRRFLARDVPANAVVRVELPAASAAANDPRVLVLVAALAFGMIVALMFSLRRR
ncbi:MAG TPA: hypothetical protein VFG84_10040 [Gemmatimonadaceae bacterium]|nr:hypothetical protein [Gemmatimonadaceae bacterium]